MDRAIDSSESAAELARYVQQKHSIGQAIRALQEFLKRCGSQARCDACHELLVKLAEDRFTLAVVGQFKRGKSSLMNTIVGRELLPTGLLPLTSVVTILRFGPRERLVIPCEGFPYEHEYPVSSLHEYVTEEGNPGNRRQIKAAYVEVSSPFLRRGLEFVDTPGIGSAIEANTETTYRFLPRCDAVLFVTSIESPLTSEELLFLRELRRYVPKVFFVVNKFDLLDDAARVKMLEFVRTVLCREMATDNIRMFPVSARDGLAAKLSGNQQQLVVAGIVELENALSAFLASERAATFLVAIVDQATRLLEEERRKIDRSKHDGSPAAPSPEHNRMTETEQNSQCSGLRSRLELLRSGVLLGTVPEIPMGDSPDDFSDVSLASSKPPMEPNVELATRGCPVCDCVKQSLFDFYCQFQYRLENEASTQKLLAEECGFCPLHTWHLSTISSQVGISAGYAPLVHRLSVELSALALEARGSASAVKRLLARTETCRACRIVRNAEEENLKRMAELLQKFPYREQYAGSQGVCLRHLAMLLELPIGQETERFLLKEAARHYQEVAEDMLSFVIKREATRRALLNEDEQDAYVRALTHLAGSRYLANSNPPDAELSFPAAGPGSS